MIIERNYVVVQSPDLDELVDSVNELMAEDWETVGGISVAHRARNDQYASDLTYCQAMVYKGED